MEELWQTYTILSLISSLFFSGFSLVQLWQQQKCSDIKNPASHNTSTPGFYPDSHKEISDFSQQFSAQEHSQFYSHNFNSKAKKNPSLLTVEFVCNP